MLNSVYRNLTERVKLHEGFRERPYFDSIGVGTIGYGFTYLKKEECDKILDNRLKEATGLVEGYLMNEGITLDDFRIAILVEMTFQLGFKGVLGFKKMWKALRDMDYAKAAAEMKNSRWFKQTPTRSADLANKMMKGY
jgi:lysozyme